VRLGYCVYTGQEVGELGFASFEVSWFDCAIGLDNHAMALARSAQRSCLAHGCDSQHILTTASRLLGRVSIP
jgi:hypothetical protein